MIEQEPPRTITVDLEGDIVRDWLVARANGRVPAGLHALDTQVGQGIYIVAANHPGAEVSLRVIPRQGDEHDDPDTVAITAIARVNAATRDPDARHRGLCQRADQIRVEVRR